MHVFTHGLIIKTIANSNLIGRVKSTIMKENYINNSELEWVEILSTSTHYTVKIITRTKEIPVILWLNAIWGNSVPIEGWKGHFHYRKRTINPHEIQYLKDEMSLPLIQTVFSSPLGVPLDFIIYLRGYSNIVDVCSFDAAEPVKRSSVCVACEHLLISSK